MAYRLAKLGAHSGVQRPLLLILLVVSLGTVATPGQAQVIISGTITYSGAYGPVLSVRPIRISLHASAPAPSHGCAHGEPLAQAVVTTNAGAFAVNVPAAGDYCLGYYLDVNNDDRATVGEPIQFYDSESTPWQADTLHVPASGVTGLALEFADVTRLSGIAGTIMSLVSDRFQKRSSWLGSSAASGSGENSVSN
jgi:hypothetical protein